MPRLPQPLEILKSLAAAASRLASCSPAAPVEPPAEQAPASSARRPSSGRVGKYDEPLSALVRRRPGVTVAQAAEKIGVHPTALYPVIRRLETRGQLVKLGRELHPARAASAPRAAGGPEQLWCEEGHWWQRPPTRGRKPKRCPEHR